MYLTMLGWFKRCINSISAWIDPSDSSSMAVNGNLFTATKSPVSVLNPWYTTAKPPRPISVPSWYVLVPLLILSPNSRILRRVDPVPVDRATDSALPDGRSSRRCRLPLLLPVPLSLLLTVISAAAFLAAELLLLLLLPLPPTPLLDEPTTPVRDVCRIWFREDCDRASIDSKLALENRSSRGGTGGGTAPFLPAVGPSSSGGPRLFISSTGLKNFMPLLW